MENLPASDHDESPLESSTSSTDSTPLEPLSLSFAGLDANEGGSTTFGSGSDLGSSTITQENQCSASSPLSSPRTQEKQLCSGSSHLSSATTQKNYQGSGSSAFYSTRTQENYQLSGSSSDSSIRTHENATGVHQNHEIGFTRPTEALGQPMHNVQYFAATGMRPWTTGGHWSRVYHTTVHATNFQEPHVSGPVAVYNVQNQPWMTPHWTTGGQWLSFHHMNENAANLQEQHVSGPVAVYYVQNKFWNAVWPVRPWTTPPWTTGGHSIPAYHMNENAANLQEQHLSGPVAQSVNNLHGFSSPDSSARTQERVILMNENAANLQEYDLNAPVAQVSGLDSGLDLGLPSGGHSCMVSLARTEYGLRLLQSSFSTLNRRDREDIFQNVIDFIFQLMTDELGSRFFRILIESCNASQLHQIVRKIRFEHEAFIAIAMDRHGVFSLLRLIEIIGTKSGSKFCSSNVTDMVQALYEAFYKIKGNRKGASIVWKCLEVFNERDNKQLYEAILDNCLQLSENDSWGLLVQHVLEVIQDATTTEKICSRLKGHFAELSMHRHGTHVVKKCLNSSDEMRNFVVRDIMESHRLLGVAKSRYGSYVIEIALQHLLEVIQDATTTEKICSLLKGHFVELSMHRHGTHVVQKLCLTCSDETRDFVVGDIMESGRVLEVAKDRYGSYVIQIVLQAAKGANSPPCGELVKELQRNREALGDKDGFGKYILPLLSMLPEN